MFSDLPAYLIGVQCPLEVLEQREHSRKNRTLGQAKLQFPVIHKYVTYDLEVDTSLLSPAGLCSPHPIPAERAAAGIPPYAADDIISSARFMFDNEQNAIETRIEDLLQGE